MPVYVVKQVVTHPIMSRVVIKTSKIIGRDIRHAIELLPISPAMRRDLERTFRTHVTDPNGRKLEIEIIDEEKAK